MKTPIQPSPACQVAPDSGCKTASLERKTEQKRASRLATTPESVKGHFVAAWAEKCSPRRAIKAQCLECQGFDRDATTGCTSFACALWNFRPFQKSAEGLPN